MLVELREVQEPTLAFIEVTRGGGASTKGVCRIVSGDRNA